MKFTIQTESPPYPTPLERQEKKQKHTVVFKLNLSSPNKLI